MASATNSPINSPANSPKPFEVFEAPSPKKIVGEVFTINMLGKILNNAKHGVEFEGCSMLCGKTLVPLDKDGRATSTNTK